MVVLLRLTPNSKRHKMLGLLRRFFSKDMITNVPYAIAACQDCRSTECGRDKFTTCEYRLAREAALKAQAAQATKARA
jgi:hypothetical protein